MDELTDSLWIGHYLAVSDAAMREFCGDLQAQLVLAEMGRLTAECLARGGKLLVCGNGGSAADAQHIAGELVSRFMYDRTPLAAIALTTDTSSITAIGNDYGFEHVFERQVRALGRAGDVLLAISTSGRSLNVLRCLDTARAAGITTLGFTGSDGGELAERCDFLLKVSSNSTPVVQQIHITAAHVLCAIVERRLCPAGTRA